jgi:alanine racemase
VNLWLKLDTGMNRLGFPPNEFREAYDSLRALPFVNLTSVMTHFSNADDLGNSETERQIDLFDETAGNLPLEHSLANSAALLGWPASRRQWVRPGIMLYGASPFQNGSADADGLQPVMTLCSKLISIRQVPQGESVGYGGEWTATRDSVIGVVAAGYGDGYPRHAPNGTPALVNGIRCPLVGRISMDMLTVDLTGNTAAAVGDEVILWGRGLPAEEVASHVGTIPYEMFCGITRRTRFEYVQ